MSEKHIATSQYSAVADIIRERIKSGHYRRGETLPKEPELGEELGVHRSVVNRALKILLAEGLVYVHMGKGTIVTEIEPIVRHSNRYTKAAREANGSRGAFDAENRNAGRTPRSDVEVYRAEPPAVVASIFGSDAEVVVRHRKMYLDNHPVQIATSYIPVDIAAGTAIEQVDSGPGGIISRFAELGYEQVEIEESKSVRPPTDEEAGFLRLRPEAHRVYDIVHVGYAEGGRPVEVCLHVMPTHLWILVDRLPVK